MKVHIIPYFRGEDKGDGGIRRIVEAQHLWLPKLGIEITPELDKADLIATHAGTGLRTSVPNAMPWVVHTHGLYWDEYQWADWGHRLNSDVIMAIRRSDHVTAPSEWVAQALRRGMWLRPTVLHHGVDVDQWTPSKDPGDYILWNKNRPDPICDPSALLQMAIDAPDLGFVTTFGRGPDNLRTMGRIPYDAMRDLVRNAGVYLCTTRETFGIGTLEAMAAGVPVVGWAWGGQREIVEHGKTGWLCQPGDIDGLVEGARWALAHRDRIGADARQAVSERWTWDKIMPGYVELYEGVWGAKADRWHGPRVSVVIPCYNLAEYLPDAVTSILAQTMGDWEIVIVNDASPDDTAKVASALAARDSRIRVVTNDENLYLAGALNAGIAAATGRYILPLDADNMIEPWTLEILADALEADRDVDIAYGACRFVLRDGKTHDTSISPDGVSGWPTDFSFGHQMTLRNQVPSSSMYRREVWERSGGYRRRCRTAEDAEYWTRAASLGFVPKRVTDRTTLIYRQREESMSRNVAKWDWSAWVPWSRRMNLVPFGVAEKPPASMNKGIAWNVPTSEPAGVAVVIPVGPGHEDLLIDALDSVEAQTYRRWECIVANDTGHPLSIPHSWAKIIDMGPEPQGPAAGRNAAIKASTAPLFVTLDADDYLQADALEQFVGVHNVVGGVVYSQWFDDKGADGISVYDPPDYDAKLLVSKGAIHAVTALYPKSAWSKVQGFDETLSHWEDWDFQLSLADIQVCGTKIPRPLFTYRKDTGQRREMHSAAFNQGKDAILAKWSRLWDGGEELMACQGCPGGGGKRYAAPPAAGVNGGAGVARIQPREGYVVLAYQGASTSTRVYRGTATGTRYRFGNSPSHKIKYVFEADLPALLSLRDGGHPLFEQQSPPEQGEQREQSPVMVAPGAPKEPEAPPESVGVPSIEAQPPPVLPETHADLPDGQRTVIFGEDATVLRPDPTAPPGPIDPLVHAAQQEEAAVATAPVLFSIRELRAKLREWDPEAIARHLAHEKAQESPRPTAVSLMEARLRGMQ